MLGFGIFTAYQPGDCGWEWNRAYVNLIILIVFMNLNNVFINDRFL